MFSKDRNIDFTTLDQIFVSKPDHKAVLYQVATLQAHAIFSVPQDFLDISLFAFSVFTSNVNYFTW